MIPEIAPLLGVDLDVRRRGHAHAERLGPIGMPNDETAVGELSLFPIAERRSGARQALLDDARSAVAEPFVETFDARDVAPASRAFEDHADVVFADRARFEPAVTHDAC